MTNNEIGNIGEAKAILHFTENGYEVYKGMFGHEKYDFIAVKGEEKLTVSVKTSLKPRKRSGYYEINITQDKRTGNKTIPFNPNSCTVMFVYCIMTDDIVILNCADEIQSRYSVNIRPNHKIELPDFEKGKRYSDFNFSSRSGERNGNSKFTNEEVKEIRDLYKKGVGNKDLSKIYKCAERTIYDITSNRTYKM